MSTIQRLAASHRRHLPLKELYLTCPQIIPVAGDTIVTNGNMETGDPPSSWIATNATLDGVADERTGGSGAQSLNIAATANSGQAAQALTTVAGTWYAYTSWLKKTVGSDYIALSLHGIVSFNYRFQTTWGQSTYVRRAAETSQTLKIIIAVSGEEGRADDVSVKPLTFSTLRTYLGRRARRPGTYICRPTLTSGTPAGILLGYQDDNNFVLALHDGTNAKLIQRINGTYTEMATGAAAYAAERELKVIVGADDATYKLYYNNVQIGADQTISGATLGTRVHGFSTLSTNQVGLVTTSRATA